MKKTITLLLFAVFCLVGTTNAQQAQSTNVQDLLTRLAQIGVSHASISDYFTQEEQGALKRHFANRIPAPNERVSKNYDTSLFGATSLTGTSTGTSVYNGPAGTATKMAYGENPTRMPVVITHSVTQTIEAGSEIACADAISYRDNSVFRDFDLATDFGIAGDFEVTNAEVAIGAGVLTPAGFPMTVNIWSSTGAAFPNGTLTLLASEVVTITSADSETIISVPIVATVPAGEVMVLEAMIVDDLTATNFMRFGANLDGQTGVSWILAEACGATVISDMAVAFGLDNAFVMNVVGDEATTGGGGLGYCAMNSTVEFGSFDPADGTIVTPLGASSAAGFENAGSIDGTTGIAYVLDNLGDAYSVDIATAAYTSLGNIAGDWLGAEFDPTSGIYYALAADLNLYTVDFAGLSATLVGATGFTGFPIGLAIDGAGVAYAYDVVDDNMYTVDLGTGAATLLGAIGFDANFGQGMGYDALTDTVYMTAFNNTVFDSELRIVDTATGNTALVNQMDSAALTQYAWVSFEGVAVVLPPNDECAGAIDVNCGDVVVGETITATDSGNNAAPDLWYSFTGMGLVQDITVSLCDGGTDYDSILRLFDACGGAEIATNDDSCGLQSELTFSSDGTSTYWIMIEGFGSSSGNFSMAITCSPEDPTGPPNDLCDGALPLACDDAITGDTTDATNTDNPGTCDTALDTAPGLWYLFETPADGDYTVTIDTFGSAYDTKLGVFSGDCGALVCVAGNDDDGGLQSLVEFTATSGESYYVYVTGFSTSAGAFNLNVACTILIGYEDNAIAGFNYYPNPATNAINLSAQNNIETVAIFNVLGQKVVDQNVEATSTSLDVSNLSVGTYIMKVSVDGQIGTYKIVKK
jgi:hypothetical protein